MEHPDITRALETGYPKNRRWFMSYECDMCREPLVEKSGWYSIDDRKVCEDCIDIFRQDPDDAIIEEDDDADYER